MPRFRTRLLRVGHPCEGVIEFYLEKPAGFVFRPGQYADLTLVDPPPMDGEGPVRTFSIASAPYENELLFATRERPSTFKQYLAAAPAGVAVDMEGPAGDFTLHRNTSKPAVFLAGGIGITPFHSILVQAAHDKLPHDLYLFHGNARPESAPFLDGLGQLTRINPRFRFVPVMEQPGHDWSGARGRIDGHLIAQHLPSLAGPIYYIAGPPAMVTALRQTLLAAGVDEDDIRTEEFAGY